MKGSALYLLIMFEDLKNKFDFYIRTKTKFSRKNYSGNINNSEAEYLFDILTNYFPIDFQENISVLDIGSKNWAYVKGEYDFFKNYSNQLILDGVEIDAYRLNSNFYSRYEIAQFYIKNLHGVNQGVNQGVNYYPDNLLNINKKYNYIIWLLPFITIYPLQKWGLPKKYFMPEKLLEHAYKLLNKQMLIVNQGEEEAEIQKNMLDNLGIEYKKLGTIESQALEFKNSRYGFLVQKK